MTIVEIHQLQDKEKKNKTSMGGKPILPDNPQEFEGLFKEHYQDLCRYCLRFVKQEVIAEELVQDVFIKLWRKKKYLEVHSSIKAYLFTAVRNSSINYLKSQFARQQFEEHDVVHHSLQTNSTQESMDYQELSLLVSEAVDQLPEQCRKIFEMSRSGGFSHEEIAKELKISPKTVENQIGIALKKIKTISAKILGPAPDSTNPAGKLMDTSNKIAKFLSGTCNEQEITELEAWRRAEPANEEEFRKFEKICKLNPQAASFTPNVSKAWERVSSCIFNEEKEKPVNLKKNPSGTSLFFQNYWKVAATVCLLLLAGFIFFLRDNFTTTSFYEGLVKLETGSNERKDVVLNDGTRLWLNENSSIYYPEVFSDYERMVHLEGEAYFEVKSLPDQPFIIYAGSGEIKVLGTAFNIQAINNRKVKLQVVNGRVEFSSTENPASSVILEGGEAAELRDQEVKALQQDKNFLAWKTGEFIFEDVDLGKVLKTLESYYSVSFSSADKALLNCRLSARFKQQSIEEVLQVLDVTLNIAHSYNKEKGEVVLNYTGKGPHCSDINN